MLDGTARSEKPMLSALGFKKTVGLILFFSHHGAMGFPSKVRAPQMCRGAPNVNPAAFRYKTPPFRA